MSVGVIGRIGRLQQDESRKRSGIDGRSRGNRRFFGPSIGAVRSEDTVCQTSVPPVTAALRSVPSLPHRHHRPSPVVCARTASRLNWGVAVSTQLSGPVHGVDAQRASQPFQPDLARPVSRGLKGCRAIKSIRPRRPIEPGKRSDLPNLRAFRLLGQRQLFSTAGKTLPPGETLHSEHPLNRAVRGCEGTPQPPDGPLSAGRPRRRQLCRATGQT